MIRILTNSIPLSHAKPQTSTIHSDETNNRTSKHAKSHRNTELH